ncbi:MAG: hypothetical protein LBF37_03965, partial [Rickettsiales bacterium]|nr:hypothetical protein [Rickettsiales bacterium]
RNGLDQFCGTETDCVDGYSGGQIIDNTWVCCKTPEQKYINSTTVTGGVCLITENCNCNSCTWPTACTTPTHCTNGYYKTGSTCAECPDKAVGATTSGYTNTGITACYFPKNITVTDSTGSYEFTNNCSYTN